MGKDIPGKPATAPGMNLCGFDLACSANLQGCKALAGLRPLSKQKAVESEKRFRALVAKLGIGVSFGIDLAA
jgi:hypothetical protein